MSTSESLTIIEIRTPVAILAFANGTESSNTSTHRSTPCGEFEGNSTYESEGFGLGGATPVGGAFTGASRTQRTAHTSACDGNFTRDDNDDQFSGFLFVGTTDGQHVLVVYDMHQDSSVTNGVASCSEYDSVLVDASLPSPIGSMRDSWSRSAPCTTLPALV